MSVRINVNFQHYRLTMSPRTDLPLHFDIPLLHFDIPPLHFDIRSTR